MHCIWLWNNNLFLFFLSFFSPNMSELCRLAMMVEIHVYIPRAYKCFTIHVWQYFLASLHSYHFVVFFLIIYLLYLTVFSYSYLCIHNMRKKQIWNICLVKMERREWVCNPVTSCAKYLWKRVGVSRVRSSFWWNKCKSKHVNEHGLQLKVDRHNFVENWKKNN